MKNSPSTKAETPETLLNSLRSLAAEAEKYIHGAVSEQTEEAFNRLRQRFDAAQELCSEMYAVARQQVVASAKYTDATIRANPYQSAAIALGVGLLLGVFVGRRES